MTKPAFNGTVAARGRCAMLIHSTPELLNIYEAVGGTPDDLLEIADAATSAHAFNLLQSQSGVDATAATAQVARGFLELQHEYRSVLDVVVAVVNDVKRAGTSPELARKLQAIVVNEAQLQISTVEVDGAKKRKVKRSASQEALRAEIEKDAAALLALTDAHALLARRKVDVDRLQALRTNAKNLSGRLADRAAKKGAKVTATQQEREAVERQSATWTACYRLLAAVGERDPRVEALLKETSKKKR